MLFSLDSGHFDVIACTYQSFNSSRYHENPFGIKISGKPPEKKKISALKAPLICFVNNVQGIFIARV